MKALILLMFAPSLLSARDLSNHVLNTSFFEKNRGQLDGRVQFASRGREGSIYLTKSTAVLSLNNAKPVRMRLVGSSESARVEGFGRLSGVSHYYIGKDPSKWVTDVPQYAGVRYRGVYQGIDLVYYRKDGKLEYDFVVAPGADPHIIQIKYEGADKLSIDKRGDLWLELAAQKIRHHRPGVFQEVDGKQVEVEGGYELLAHNQVQFRIGEYDNSIPLTIDPVIEYSTYLGGPGENMAQGIAVDASRNAYITGWLQSPNYPDLDPFQQAHGNAYSIFTAKLSSSGDAVLYYTYVGGSSINQGRQIAVDSSGNAYVAGFTYSPDFPTLTPAQANYGGGSSNGVIFKLSPSGKLLYSTYLGGSVQDAIAGLAVDTSGSAYVTGFTMSSDFPTHNALQPKLTGNHAFVARLSPKGDQLVFSTYLGGSIWDNAQGLALDTDGNVLVVGETRSPDFPMMNPLQSNFGVSGFSANGFITKLSPDGSKLLYSSYFGGSSNIGLNEVASDQFGNVYVAGYSFDSKFPTKNALQPVFGGGNNDAIVAKLNPALNAVMYATYLGGSSGDVPYGMVVSLDGTAYVIGSTDSSDFPSKDSLQSFLTATSGVSRDVFVTKLSPVGGLAYSSFIGGHGRNEGLAIARDPSGGIYIAGTTSAEDFPVKNPIQSTLGGGDGDMYILKLAAEVNTAPILTLSPAVVSFQFVMGGATPSARSVSVTSSESALSFIPTSDVNWLRVTSSSNTPPATLTISLVPAGLAAGDYEGTIQVATGNTIPVKLTVFAQGTPVINMGGVVNAASYLGGTVSPGEIITIFGTNVGPSTPAGAVLDGSGLLAKLLANTRVLFDGSPAPLVYVSATQVSAVAPFVLANQQTTELQIEYNGLRSPAVSLSISVAAPGVFMQLPSTRGAILNQDGKLNTETNPAARGSIVVFYLTGAGATEPPGIDGKPGAQPLPKPILPVTVTIGGAPAQVIYAGGSSGIVAGGVQVNARIALNATTGVAVPLIASVGGVASQTVTIAVQ